MRSSIIWNNSHWKLCHLTANLTSASQEIRSESRCARAQGWENRGDKPLPQWVVPGHKSMPLSFSNGLSRNDPIKNYRPLSLEAIWCCKPATTLRESIWSPVSPRYESRNCHCGGNYRIPRHLWPRSENLILLPNIKKIRLESTSRAQRPE